MTREHQYSLGIAEERHLREHAVTWDRTEIISQHEEDNVNMSIGWQRSLGWEEANCGYLLKIKS